MQLKFIMPCETFVGPNSYKILKRRISENNYKNLIFIFEKDEKINKVAHKIIKFY